MRTIKLDRALRRMVCMAFSIGIATTLVPLPGQVALADPIDTLVTAYQPVISETTDANGFLHPGVGFTKAQLENMRAEVLAKKEPWYTHFNMMLNSASASRTPRIRNVSGADPTKPAFYGLTSQGQEGNFIVDAGIVYTQAVLYLVTGDDVYRANPVAVVFDRHVFRRHPNAHRDPRNPRARVIAAERAAPGWDGAHR